MKVIFLDIDGVLNVYPPGRDEYGDHFMPHLIENLKYILDNTGAKIVVSSSWRLCGEQTMKEMWEKRNLPGEVIGITPNMTYGINCNTSTPRGKEIERWLYTNIGIESYVILDDDSDMLEDQMINFVRTSDNPTHPDHVDIGYGLTRICAEQAIEILNRK